MKCDECNESAIWVFTRWGRNLYVCGEHAVNLLPHRIPIPVEAVGELRHTGPQ